MKRFVFFVCFFSSLNAFAQYSFSDIFYPKTLRIDFVLSGNNETTQAALYRLVEEPHWGGRTARMDTSLRLGDYLILVQDEGKNTIYEEGFATLFEEWQSTEEAQTLTRTFPNTCLVPYPRVMCDVYILRRDMLVFQDTILHFNFEPNSRMIQKSSPPPYAIDTIQYHKSSNKALDIVILAEGFQSGEMDEFRKLSQELSQTLCSARVFDKNKERINFYAIASASIESGTDRPTKKVWKNTLFDASFYTLYSARYLMAKNVWSIRDAASLVPYDQIYIIVNTPIYGGGGVYNYYAICSAYGQSNKEVLIHEFGHSFAALADEYYYDDEILIDYVNKAQEPWQKNITTLVDFSSKWKDRVPADVPIPTPLRKAKKYPIGVYEGAAYVSKGIYRACPDCRMKTNDADDFCPICESAIQEVIDFLCDE